MASKYMARLLDRVALCPMEKLQDTMLKIEQELRPKNQQEPTVRANLTLRQMQLRMWCD